MVVVNAQRKETIAQKNPIRTRLVKIRIFQRPVNSTLCYRMRKRIRYAMPRKTLAELQKKLREPYSNQIEDDENESLADKDSDALLSYR